MAIGKGFGKVHSIQLVSMVLSKVPASYLPVASMLGPLRAFLTGLEPWLDSEIPFSTEYLKGTVL